ncbi:hypothetical protein HB779_19555 [Phyllobacterium sp. 628]|uniref:DUF6638 family protein n=1 Tax=Phyllobacterium sp. 628 TaxID=2718938 RepID=UPI0016625FD4|nr:DUF6638 family protein [Phyllobacterium sp. 628]QND53844.1 hypothetical protein HB779_19555 [Phyllobacterium sp. 628]
MDLLYENELIYGRLLTIDQPHLIERYNRALEAFGFKPTKLKSFDIDRTGFSPEIAKELKDPAYLDPNGVNRRFIILTPDQAILPVVHTQFSNTSQLMYEFFSSNARAINALTIKDVIYGEIEDSVSVVNDIEDLLSINQVEFRVLSAENVMGQAAELRLLVDRLQNEPDTWRNDDVINRMVELAKITGDIRENSLVPDKVVFRHNAFWTSHFGGIYIFVDDNTTTVIGDPSAPGFRRSRPWQVNYISIKDAEQVFQFLSSTGRIELPRGSWIEQSGYLENRGEMIIRHLIQTLEPERSLTGIDRIWLQTWIHTNASLINHDGTWPFLNGVKREITQTGQINLSEIDPVRRFLVVRALPHHSDAWLVNQLISDFVPWDFLSRYVFNKQGFYADYSHWRPGYQEHVVDILKTTYLKDKEGLRKRLYGLTS